MCHAGRPVDLEIVVSAALETAMGILRPVKHCGHISVLEVPLLDIINHTGHRCQAAESGLVISCLSWAAYSHTLYS